MRDFCRWIIKLVFVGIPFLTDAKEPVKAYDLQMAKEICDELPLENIEGVWLYPDDKVTVTILREETELTYNEFPSYSISVIDTSDARLHPGEEIGRLYATAEADVYRIELSTEKKNELLLKPKSVLATLSKDGETLLIKQQKSPLKGRVHLNINRLLPGFWKIVSIGVSSNANSSVKAPLGMVKIYPSYDGNGSSKRKIRYL